MPGPAGGAMSGSVGNDRAYTMTSTALPTPSSSSSFSSPAPPNQQQNDSKQPHRKTRSTRGCLTCRKTKVKCDETTPCCVRCEKSGRECHWPSAIQLAFPRKSKRMTGENVSSVGRHGAAEQGAVLPQRSDRNVSSSSSIPASDATSSPFHHHSQSMFAGELNDTMYAPSPISMINSSLASRRAAKRRRTTTTTTATALPGSGSRSSNIRDEAPQNDSQPILIRGIDIEALANAVMSDLTITDMGSSMSSDGHQPDIASAHALKGAFPSTIALQLFQYFYQVASRALVTMGDKGVNPILTLCTPNRILDTSCAAAAALRMSILSISLAHISNELRTSPHLTYDEQRRTACMKGIKRLAARLKSATLANIVLVEEDENEKDQFDTVLASCVLTMIRDVISGDTSWRENFEYAIRLVTKRGGPEVVLNEDKGNFTRRFLLESLAAHDIFSCFVTHKEPALMDRFEPWWYSCVDNSVASWEWESVERTFGVSRGMLEFFARVATLDAQKRRLGIDFRSPDESMRKGEDFLHRQADSLLLELDVWCNGLNSTAQHVRVKCGDYIYKYSANVFILGSILDYPPESERIVNSIDYVLELCSEATAMRQVVMLVWPLLICGSFCLESRRQKIVELIDAFQSDYCEDLQAAREIILAQWDGIDRGLGRQSFRQVMDRINKCVLLI